MIESNTQEPIAILYIENDGIAALIVPPPDDSHSGFAARHGSGEVNGLGLEVSWDLNDFSTIGWGSIPGMMSCVPGFGNNPLTVGFCARSADSNSESVMYLVTGKYFRSSPGIVSPWQWYGVPHLEVRLKTVPTHPVPKSIAALESVPEAKPRAGFNIYTCGWRVSLSSTLQDSSVRI